MDQTFERPAAAAQIQGGSLAPQLTGTIRFFPVKRGVLVTANVQGLPADNPCGVFALHIHTGSSCAGAAFEETGAHYNPSGAAHPCHAGDLPPLFSCGGCAFLGGLDGPLSAAGRAWADGGHPQRPRRLLHPARRKRRRQNRLRHYSGGVTVRQAGNDNLCRCAAPPGFLQARMAEQKNFPFLLLRS